MSHKLSLLPVPTTKPTAFPAGRFSDAFAILELLRLAAGGTGQAVTTETVVVEGGDNVVTVPVSLDPEWFRLTN
jgi:hypothetical protein